MGAGNLRAARGRHLPCFTSAADRGAQGRTSDTRRYWHLKPVHPLCQEMATQKHSYAYAAVSIADGDPDTLIVPHVNGGWMQCSRESLVKSFAKGDREVKVALGICQDIGDARPDRIRCELECHIFKLREVIAQPALTSSLLTIRWLELTSSP
jgi:hypothetical protein